MNNKSVTQNTPATIKIENSKNVLVIGIGFIGLMFIEVLKNYNLNIIGCDINEERVSLAKNFGATLTFNTSDIKESLNFILNNTESIGADVVILASGSTKSIDLSTALVRDGGKILVFASIPDENKGFINNSIYYRELSVIGGYSSAPEYLNSAMNLLRCDNIKVDKLCNIMRMDELSEAVEQIITQKVMKVYLKI